MLTQEEIDFRNRNRPGQDKAASQQKTPAPTYDPFDTNSSGTNPFARKPKAPLPPVPPAAHDTVQVADPFSVPQPVKEQDGFSAFQSEPSSSDPFAPAKVTAGVHDQASFPSLTSRVLEARSGPTTGGSGGGGPVDPFKASATVPPAPEKGVPPPLPPRNKSMKAYSPQRPAPNVPSVDPQHSALTQVETRERQDTTSSTDSLTPSEKEYRDSHRPVRPAENLPVSQSSITANSAPSVPHKSSLESNPFFNPRQEEESHDTLIDFNEAFAEADRASSIFKKKTIRAADPLAVSSATSNSVSQDPFGPKPTATSSITANQSSSDPFGKIESSSKSLSQDPFYTSHKHGPLEPLTRSDADSKAFSIEDEAPEYMKDFLKAPSFAVLTRADTNVDPFAEIDEAPVSPPLDLKTPDPFVPSDTPVQTPSSLPEAEPVQPQQYQSTQQPVVDTYQAEHIPALNEYFEAQTQQAAYLALKAQVDSGVVFTSAEEQQEVYQAYYTYYFQYYLQQQQQYEAQQVTQEVSSTELTSEMQTDLLNMKIRAETAEAYVQQLEKDLLTANQKLVATTSTAESISMKFSSEIASLKAELSAAKQRELKLRNEANEMEAWKAKCEFLSSQLEAAAGSSTAPTNSPGNLNKRYILSSMHLI